MSPNANILEALSHIAESYRSQGVVYKYKAYRTAIDSIRSLGAPVTDVSQVATLPGIGKAMLEKIQEILRTGELQQEKDVAADPVAQAVQAFTAVHGIGPVLAKKLVHEHGLRTLADLTASQHMLPPQARLGLRYHDDTLKRVPFDEIEEHLRYMKSVALASVDPGLQLSVCGSHRRGAETSGDIDILVTHPASCSTSGAEYVFLGELSKVLKERGYVVDVLAEGQSKFMGFCRLTPSSTVRRLDVRWFTYDSFPSALLYFTGSDMFNVAMRTEALKRGYTINEYGIFELVGYEHLHETLSPKGKTELPPPGAVKGRRMPVHCERDIFQYVGMPFLEPHQRNK